MDAGYVRITGGSTVSCHSRLGESESGKTLLALVAGYLAKRVNNVSIPVLALVVLAYQLVGTLGEWAMVGNLSLALQDFRIGIPGMVLQVFGGYLFIRYLIAK